MREKNSIHEEGALPFSAMGHGAASAQPGAEHRLSEAHELKLME